MPNVPDGCSYSSSCFTCPLSKCRYETDYRIPATPETFKRILKIRRLDLDVPQIRELWPMSYRNALRLLNQARQMRI